MIPQAWRRSRSLPTMANGARCFAAQSKPPFSIDKKPSRPATQQRSSQLRMFPPPSSASSPHESEKDLGHSTVPNVSSQARFPTGTLRDSRFGEVESGEMEITFLGTASCIPTVTRGVSAIALRYIGDVWLFDCGESTQKQLQNSRIRPSKIKKIFISHSHGDHCFGLPGVLCMLGQSTMDERERSAEEGEEPTVVDIYGPEGTRDFIRAAMQLSYSRVTAPYRVHEFKNVPLLHGRNRRNFIPPVVRTRFDRLYGEREGGLDIFPDNDGIYRILEDDSSIVQAAPMQHTVPCLGFVVTEKDRPGSLKVEMVNDLVQQNRRALDALPENKGNFMKTFRILKDLGQQESFTFPNGVTVHGKDINEPPRRGRKIVVMGDTSSGHMIQNIAMDADVLIHEATNAFFPDAAVPRFKTYWQLERDSVIHGHSTPQMAGKFAATIRAKRLVLTHFSPRYLGDSSETSMRMMWRVEDMARQTSGLMRMNDVVAAWDHLSLSVPVNDVKQS